MKRIHVVDNAGNEYHYDVDRPVTEITIGRSDNNHIILDSKTVSRRHAILKITPERVILVNKSANGVFVNGERIELERSRELYPGEYATIDIYQVGVEVPGRVSGQGPAYGRNPARQTGQDAQVRRPSRAPSRVSQSAPPVGQPGPGAPAAPPMSRRSGAPQQAAPRPAERPVQRRPATHAPTPQGAPASDRGKVNSTESFEVFMGQMFAHEGQEEPRVNLDGQAVQRIDRRLQKALGEFKSRMHDALKDRLDLHSFEITDYRNPKVVKQVVLKLKEVLGAEAHNIPQPATREQVFKDMMDEVCGLGPIEDLLNNSKVTEVMVVDRDHIYAELDGSLVLTDRYFFDRKSMMTVIERIVVPRGRRIDESMPLVDTRLEDGSRVNAVIAPLALKDPCLTIRKFPEDRLSVRDLVRFGSLTMDMAKFLGRAVRVRKNIIISGGTGSGKTTLLNVMSSFIGPTERVVTIEDAAELQLQQEHVVSLETKPANLEGKGEISIRDLVKNALRMRPDRIVVGECRGGEALDMLQAMNTGHDGSMTTVHSNSPTEAIARLETLVLMSGMELPTRAIREQIANSVDIIVQQTRFSDGSRRISYITEVVGMDDDGFVRLEDIFRYRQTGMDEKNKVQGYHLATGYLPSFLNDFLIQGLATPDDFF